MRWPMEDARLWEIRACEMHACEIVHAYEMAYGRGTPMRDTPMRDTPMRWPL